MILGYSENPPRRGGFSLYPRLTFQESCHLLAEYVYAKFTARSQNGFAGSSCLASEWSATNG